MSTLGICTVPNGTSGPWIIDTFSVSDREAAFTALRAMVRGTPEEYTPAGTYRRLWHKQRGVVMSNTPMEVETHEAAYDAARGRVLVAGLGLGMFVEAVLGKPDVTHVTVIEVDPHVVALTAPHFAHDPRFHCITASIFDYAPGPDDPPFDFAWFDIWDDICEEYLPAMRALRMRGLARASACWSEELAKRNRARRRADNRRAA